MDDLDYQLELISKGQTGYRSAASELVRLIDESNVDRVMRALPPGVFRWMRIQAGYQDRSTLFAPFCPPQPEPFRIAALREWLERNGTPPLQEDD